MHYTFLLSIYLLHASVFLNKCECFFFALKKLGALIKSFDQKPFSFACLTIYLNPCQISIHQMVGMGTNTH